MEFDKSRVYTALNADELKVGSKVIVADKLATLRREVEENHCPITLEAVLDEETAFRFRTDGIDSMLCYLVSESKEPRRMTNRELAKWLSQGNGQWMGSTNTVSTTYSYGIFDDREVPASIMIRGWDEAEWHDALIKED